MMYLNLYSVRIPEGEELPGGYVELEHMDNYTIVLRNSRLTRCDAQVYIDGKHVGTWRIPAHSNIRLERPAHDTGKFTFIASNTKEYTAAQLDKISRSDLGLIKVVFTPEVMPTEKDNPVYRTYTDSTGTVWTYSQYYITSNEAFTPDPTSTSWVTTNYSDTRSGGTGLTGHSNQNFSEADSIHLDLSNQTVIHLRLVKRKDGTTVRPLTQFSTPIPPPVD